MLFIFKVNKIWIRKSLLYNVFKLYILWIFLEKVEENVFVIYDYNGFNIWVNGEKVFMNVVVNDDKWYYMVMIWESLMGIWKVYKDGSFVRKSDLVEFF